MKITYLLVLLNFLPVEIFAQTSFIDTKLTDISCATLKRTMLEWGGDITEAGLSIVKSTGEVIVDLGLEYTEGKVKAVPGLNAEPIECGIGRLVLFLALTDILPPDLEVDTGTYIDSLTECEIIDDEKLGGGRLSLRKCADISDCGIIRAAEIAFKKGRYASSLRKTGIFFEDGDECSGSDELFRPCQILYNSPMTLLQQLAWINGCVLNQGKIILRFDTASPSEPACVVRNWNGLNELRQAMSLTVQEGSARRLNCPDLSVCAHINVSPEDGLNCRQLTAFASLSDKRGSSFTIAVYLNKYQLPFNREIPAGVLKTIINYMQKNGYLETKPMRYHPAER